jgi:hypothetical protein
MPAVRLQILVILQMRGLLNQGRKLTEKIIDNLYKQIQGFCAKKP